MDKHRYSTLTDKQHERLVREIEYLETTEDDNDARIYEKRIEYMLRMMDGFGFITPCERAAYMVYMRQCLEERKNKKEKATV